MSVSEISIFYTKLLTPDNRLIIIPNGALSNSSLMNVSQMDKRRIDLNVGIAYEADLKKAKDILYQTAVQEPLRLPKEEISVFVNQLGDSAVDLGLRVWVNAADYWTVRCSLLENIKLALDANQISIPYPQLDVAIKK